MNATRTMPDTPAAQSLMSGVLAVFRHEWRQLVCSPLTYIFQIGFLAALAICIFLIADFYASDEASIRPMLVFLPWIALVFVPALAMRSWVDAPGDRAIELTLTLPAPVWSVVLGKFLAGSAILLVTLLFTAPFAATVAYLGEPDPGVVFSGYLAAALLLVSFYAIAVFAAALMREQVGAFVVGLSLLFVSLLLGWDVFARLLRDQIPATLYGAITSFSPKFWLDRIASGHIEAAGLLYFCLIIATALFATVLAARLRHVGSIDARAALRGGALAAGLIAALAVAITVAREIPFAADLTAEKEFTLHAGTREIIGKAPEGIEIVLYWSESEASVPAAIKSHARRIRSQLRTIAHNSNGRIALQTADPQPDSETELEALAGGLRRVPMTSGDHFFLGATFTHGRRAGRISYFDIRRERLLDYDIALALNALSRTKTPSIGILSPLLQSENASQDRAGLSFLNELRRAYDIAVIPHFKDALPEGLDVLLLIDATILRREMLYEVDQFVMNGGSLIVMMDPRLRFNRQSDAVNPEPSEEINDISDLLARYGITYQGEGIVGDMNLASLVADDQQRRLSYPYWLRIGQDGLSDAHAVTADLNEVFFAEAGALAVTAPERGIALVTTTSQSGTHDRADVQDKTPGQLAAKFKPDGKKRIIAATLRAPFASAFKMPPDHADGTKHRAASSGTPSVFVIADADWIFDPFSLQRAQVGDRVIVRPLNDNLAFLLNITEFASGDPALIAIRSRGRTQRPFTRVAELFKDVQATFREKEAQLASRIAGVEAEIAKIPQAVGVAAPDKLPENIKAQIRQLRIDLVPIRRELREIRLKSREQVDRLGRRLTVINLTAGPLLVLLFALLVRFWRARRHT